MIFNALEKKRRKLKTLSFALIDPDSKNDIKLPEMLENINKAKFDAILVGGSSIEDNRFQERIDFIKKTTNLPLILFPGDSTQISKRADAVLFISLLSGRNPKFLIEEQVKSSFYIYKHSLEVIPTGYILLKTDKKSSVEIVSQTTPLPMDNIDLILSHALAAEYLGKKLLFLETGSNSNYPVNEKLIKEISNVSEIPLIVGGGIKKQEDAEKIARAGASYIVIGSLIEESTDYYELLDINNAIHS